MFVSFLQDLIKAQDLSDLESKVAALKSEFEKTLSDRVENQKSLEETLVTAKHDLLRVQGQLSLAEKVRAACSACLLGTGRGTGGQVPAGWRWRQNQVLRALTGRVSRPVALEAAIPCTWAEGWVTLKITVYVKYKENSTVPFRASTLKGVLQFKTLLLTPLGNLEKGSAPLIESQFKQIDVPGLWLTPLELFISIMLREMS